MEAGEDEFEFAGVSVDVADCKNSGRSGFEFFGIDGDEVFFKVQAKFGDGAELHGKAEEGEQSVAWDVAEAFIVMFDRYGV